MEKGEEEISKEKTITRASKWECQQPIQKESQVWKTERVSEKSPCLYTNQLTLSCFGVYSSLLQGEENEFPDENGVDSNDTIHLLARAQSVDL